MSWQVLVTLEVEAKDADKAIAEYMRDYHPAGYGTRVESITPYTDANGKQMKKIKISRARSCD